MPGSQTKNHFQRLRFDLDALEGALLLSGAAIRRVPVTKVRQQSTLRPGNTPVRNLMQCAAKVISGKQDTVVRMRRIGRQVLGLRIAAQQTGIEVGEKTLVEQTNQVLTVVMHAENQGY